MRFLPLALLLACTGNTAETGNDTGGGDPTVDADRDGVPAADDCDDDDAAVHPGADEVCNGIDDDCDSFVDDEDTNVVGADVATFPDDDRDGFGDATRLTRRCAAGDGWVLDPSDCDDNDAAINPDAEEICDGIDNDCDRIVDPDIPTWYLDGDADEYGDPEMAIQACDQPTGYVAVAGDCDDGRRGVHPGATEICNEIDDDCDDEIDPDAPTWYADFDGDGHGNRLSSVQACEVPTGYTSSRDDCNDLRADIHPGATELCDGVDNDCDGITDPSATWYADADGDGFGDKTLTSTSCEQPSGYVAIAGDCDDTDDTVYPGAPETWYDGVDSDCDGSSDYDQDLDGVDAETWGADCDDTDASVFPGATETRDDQDEDCNGRADDLALASFASIRFSAAKAGDQPGNSVCFAGDVNADGYDDVLIGGIGEDTSATNAGAAWLVLGGPAVGSDVLSTIMKSRILGGAAEDYLGWAAASGGDQTGDGYDDVFVTAPYADVKTLVNAGSVYLFGSFVRSRVLVSDAAARLDGEVASGLLGEALSTGDTNGDGTLDVLVGAPGVVVGTDVAGRVYLLEGPISGVATVSTDAIASYSGVGAERAGSAVLLADLDDDGNDDAVIGAWRHDADRGRACFASSPSATGLDLADCDALFTGAAASDAAGTSLAAADVDGDGSLDLLLGAPEQDGGGVNAGAVHVVYGPIAAGAVDLAADDATLLGDRGALSLGDRVDTPGDLDSDGVDDVVILSGGSTTVDGEVSLVLGPMAGTMTLESAAWTLYGASSWAQAGLAAGGDFDGDKVADVIFGAPEEDLAALVEGSF